MGFKLSKSHYVLLAIFLIVLSLRFYYAFQTPYFSNTDDYFVSRQVENIRETGLQITHDELSYGGRTQTGISVFYYVLAFFNLFMPIEYVGKIIVNIFASLLVVVIYLIAYEISKDENAALFSAAISGFIPVFFKSTFNSLSLSSLAFPLLFFCIYCFLRIEEPGYLYAYLAGISFLMLINPIVVLLLIGFAFYLLLLKIDRMEQRRAEIEVILFSTLFVLWFLFIMYKKAFLFNGYAVIWQNVPKDVLRNYFSGITVLGAIYWIGSLPLLYATYAILQHIYDPHSRSSCFFSSFAFATVILLWLRLIEIRTGLICLGIISVILFAKFYKWSFDYWKKTRLATFANILVLLFIIPFFMTSLLPSLFSAEDSVKATLNGEEMGVYRSLGGNSPEGSVILAPIEEGHLVTGVAKRKNIADDNFLMIRDAEERYNDIRSIYTARFETDALKMMGKYSVDYIVLTPLAKSQFGITELSYARNSKCFDIIYDRDVKVYQVKCSLKTL